MKKALFVCYGGGHADALIPVMKQLKENSDFIVEAIGVNLAAEKLRRNGIPCKSLSYYLDVRSVEIGFELAKNRHNFNSSVCFADSIAYYGFTMGDLIDEIGEDNANEVLKIFDRRTMFPSETMIRILKIERPDVVVATTMNRFEAATLYAAACLGIPSVKVEDLIGKINKTYPDKIQVTTLEEKQELIHKGFNESAIILKEELQSSPALKYCEKIYDLQMKLRPTVSAVFCKYAKDELIARGIPEKSIYVTGQPAFDMHPKYLKNTVRDSVFAKIGADIEKKLIVFMSQPLSEREDVLRTLFAAIKNDSLNNYQFVIKLHPNEDGKIHRIILEQFELENVLITKDIDVRELMAVSDLIITVSSTTGLEAAVMGKPLLYINITDSPDDIPFEKMKIGIRCANSQQIVENINNVFSGKEVISKEIMDEYKSDSMAAKRIADIVESLAYKSLKPRKNVAIIIQARMGSSRLPGKVMMCHSGIPQIQHVVDRMRHSKLSSRVLVATSVNDNNKILKDYLDTKGIAWYAGSEDNVLERYIETAKSIDAEIVVRVTADNPLTSAVCIDKMIESHIQKEADYTTMDHLPLGITAEVVNLDTLEYIYSKNNLTSMDKEHVTYYISKHTNEFVVNYMEAPEELYAPEVSFTVDTEEEFKKMSFIYEKLYNGDYINVEDALKLVNNQ